MGFIFSKFSKLGSGAKPPSPNPSLSVAEANQLFEPTHSFWAGYATVHLICSFSSQKYYEGLFFCNQPQDYYSEMI